MVKYTTKEFKTALNVLKYPDSWFWCRYTTNPYQGCEHACIYCDARSQRYYLDDFENEVIIKLNLDKKLDQRITRARKLLPDVIGPGGVCDAYQQIEEKAENTKKLLQILEKHKWPVGIATKNSLVVRDIDLLKEIAVNTWCSVGFSITTADEDLAAFLEPYSSSPKERFEALRTIKSKAPEIQVGTYMIPIIPFLEDNEENLEEIMKKTRNAGADFILFSPGLTIRDAQAEYFIKKLKNSTYSHIVKPLLKLYQSQTYPPRDYARKLHSILYELSQKYKLPIRQKRWIPKDYRKWNYKISELLLNKEYTEAVKTGKTNKTMMWTGHNLNNLEESILDVYKRGELSKLKNFTKKIIEFVEPYLEKSKDLTKKTGLDKFL